VAAVTFSDSESAPQFGGDDKKFLPEFLQIYPKNYCDKLLPTSFLQLLVHYIFLYHVAIDLVIENLSLEICFLITQLKRGMLGCARTLSKANYLSALRAPATQV